MSGATLSQRSAHCLDTGIPRIRSGWARISHAVEPSQHASVRTARGLRRRTASQPVAFWMVAFAFATVMAGTALPSPLYPSYQDRFGFGPLTITVIYAVYAIGVLGALLLVGRASDIVGRKRVLLPGLAAAAVASALFVAVGAVHGGGLELLLTARVVYGAAAGAFTGTATAMLSDLAGPGRGSRAAMTAALANLLGTGTGPLLGGIFARWIALPLQAAFLAHLCLLALAALALAFTPETVHLQTTRQGDARPRHGRCLAVPAETRAVFVPAAAAGFAGFAVSGLFVAVTPALLASLGYHNPALTGAVIAAMFAAGRSPRCCLGSAQVGPRYWPEPACCWSGWAC